MSDISVTIGQGETYQVTLGQGILPHALSHAIGGSDTLEEYYYPRSNPSGYAQSGDFATVQYVDDISGSLYSQISFPSNVVFTTGDQAINGAKNFSIRPTVNGTGVLLSGEGGGAVSTGDLVNVFYPLNTNPSGYITGVDLSLYQTVASATGVSGYLQNQINNIDLSNLETATGNLDVRVSAIESVSGDFALDSNTGTFLTTGAGDSRYYPISSNPSGYITGVDLSDYALSSETGSFLTIEEAGNFYPRFSNPLGYLVAVDISSLASTEYVTGVSGYLQGKISALQTATGDLNNRSIKTMFISGTSVKTVTLVRTDGSTISTTFTDISGDFSVASGYLQGQIDTLNSQTGDYVLTSETGSFLTVETDPIFSASAAYSINSTLTGQWGTSYNDSITGIDVVGTSSKTITLYQRDGSTLTAGFSDIEGTGGGGNDYFLTGANFNPSNGNLNLYVNDGSIIAESLDGRYVTGDVVRPSETGNFLVSSNLNNYQTVAGSTGISGYLQTQINAIDLSDLESATGNLNVRVSAIENISGDFALKSNTGVFLTTGAGDARYYPLSSNPSSYLVSADISNLASIGYVAGVSGYLQPQILSLNQFTGQSNSGYNSSITGASIEGADTKTLTLYQRDGGTIGVSFSDLQGSGGGSSPPDKGWYFVSEVNLSGDSSVTFNISGGYKKYMAEFNGVYLTSDGWQFRSQVSFNNGSTFLETSSYFNARGMVHGYSPVEATYSYVDITPFASARSSGALFGQIIWQTTGSSTHKPTCSWDVNHETWNNQGVSIYMGAATVSVLSGINAIKFYANNTTLAGGNITLYGSRY